MRLRVMRWRVGVDLEGVCGWVRGAAVVALVSEKTGMRKRLLKIDLLGVSCRSVSEDLIGCFCCHSCLMFWRIGEGVIWLQGSEPGSGFARPLGQGSATKDPCNSRFFFSRFFSSPLVNEAHFQTVFTTRNRLTHILLTDNLIFGILDLQPLTQRSVS